MQAVYIDKTFAISIFHNFLDCYFAVSVLLSIACHFLKRSLQIQKKISFKCKKNICDLQEENIFTRSMVVRSFVSFFFFFFFWCSWCIDPAAVCLHLKQKNRQKKNILKWNDITRDLLICVFFFYRVASILFAFFFRWQYEKQERKKWSFRQHTHTNTYTHASLSCISVMILFVLFSIVRKLPDTKHFAKRP